MSNEHKCKEFEAMENWLSNFVYINDTTNCNGFGYQKGQKLYGDLIEYGRAIRRIEPVEVDDKKFWKLTNDEYAMPITYCPFCGIKL